jgi:hypothetical protein
VEARESQRESGWVVDRLSAFAVVRVKLQVPPLRSPGFPIQLSGVGELRAVFLTESRIRRLGRYRDIGNPGPLQSG